MDTNFIYKKILVLYVGGTIGMQKNDKGALIPIANAFHKKISTLSDLHDIKMAKKYFRKLQPNELILPSLDNQVVVYKIIEYEPLLDSSNMTTEHWIKIGLDISENYKKYDGFIVLHGTDTMAYSASALSFILDGLQKPVIFTGSQISIFESRSDAKDNFLSSLIIASCYNVPEVCIFFANKLMRANRTTKFKSCDLDAFHSPNYHTLGDVGLFVKMHDHYIKTPVENSSFKIQTILNDNVGILYLFPTITASMMQAFLQPPVSGIVLQSYGVGNVASGQQDLLDELKRAVKRGIIIVNISQCPQGSVSNTYETGQILENIGVISGGDMTCEAAFTKLIYVLGIPSITNEKRKQMIRTDLRGELTNI